MGNRCWDIYGLYQYADYTNNKNLFRALENWFEYQVNKGLPEAQINTTAPMITLALLAEKSDTYKIGIN